jgi:hypothetical protein
MNYDLSDYHNFPPFLKVFNMEKIHEFTGKPSRIAIEKDLYEKNKKDIDKIKISLL